MTEASLGYEPVKTLKEWVFHKESTATALLQKRGSISEGGGACYDFRLTRLLNYEK